MKAETITRFWAAVDKSGDCWLWTKTLQTNGYGSFRAEGPRWYAHRFSYLIHKGPIPQGMHVCHRCDVRRCVNPAHLFLGTAADNNRDMFAKGRARPGGFPLGTKHHEAKLDDDKVRAIRRLRRSGLSIRKIARAFQVAPRAIDQVLKGITWRHVVDDPSQIPAHL